MIESIQSFDRPTPPVLGTASEERKRELQEKILTNFKDNRTRLSPEYLQELSLLEYPKQNFEKQAIAECNHLLNELLDQSGITPFDIKEENIYIVPTKVVQENYGSEDTPNGFSNGRAQVIMLDAEKLSTPLLRCAVLAHEMIHLKGFESLETAGDTENWERRSGLGMKPTQKKYEEIGDFQAFTGLNEAIVVTIEKQLLNKLIETVPALADEWNTLFGSPEGIEKRKNIAQRMGIAEDNIFWMESGKEEGMRIGYEEQRKVLDYIIDTIHQKHPNQFSSRDDVFKLFVQAHFGGQLLPLARAVKSTFGEDAFRVLGMMSHEGSNSARLTMDYFQKKGGRIPQKEPLKTTDVHHEEVKE